jgi:hypothetical protein
MIRWVMEIKKPHGAYLINYTKEGRRFTNHVTVGPLCFGILQEEDPSQVTLRMVTY